MTKIDLYYPELVEKLPPYLMNTIKTQLYRGEVLGFWDGPESLCSLINRACWKYGVPVNEFFRKVLKIPIGNISEISHDIANRLLFSLTFSPDLIGNYSRIFGTDVSECVFHALPRITDRKAIKAISKYKRWCPHCLAENSSGQGLGYAFPVMWSLELVRHCVRHNCYLDFQCGHCFREQPFINKTYEPGYCDYCGYALYLSKPLPVVEEELELTMFMQELATDTRIYKPIDHDHSRVFKDNLDVLAKKLGDVDGEELSRSFGFDRKVFKSWRDGKSKPNIESLLIFLRAIGLISPSLIWTDNTSGSFAHYLDLDFAIQGELKLRFRNRVSNEIRGNIETYLSEIISSKKPPVSKKEIARIFEVSVGFLEYNYAARLRDIAILTKEKGKQTKEELRSNIQIQMNKAVQKIYSKGRTPTLEKAAKFLPIDILKNASNQSLVEAFERAIEVKSHLIRNLNVRANS